MDYTVSYWLLLTISFSFMLQQALTKDKALTNYLYAIFCFSISMMCIQKLSANSLGSYQYVVGLATCATCNVMWLLSRALFRKQNPVQRRHVCVALLIAMLIILNQGWHFVSELNIQSPSIVSAMAHFKTGLNESTQLLSSCILILSFWEALRNFKVKSKIQKMQSYIFASSFLVAVVNSSILSKILTNENNYDQAEPWFIASSALLVMFAVQIVLSLQKREQTLLSQKDNTDELSEEVDQVLIDGIRALIRDEKIFLKENIKIVDFASRLEVPEYKISQAIRLHFNAANFNQFLNHYRVEHAKTLLVCPNKRPWSMLVIGLESGFASAVSFNRVFKANTGQLPKQYRNNIVKPSIAQQPLEAEYL
ncbi:helix-turn-helix domain-containing protein [Paraglaciecola sp.]|uniref:helix-turn-helix domain-containing protein n=1 Tax=Paraglaciecola sp. TaxID=1920173 RepID=UPI003EF14390